MRVIIISKGDEQERGLTDCVRRIRTLDGITSVEVKREASEPCELRAGDLRIDLLTHTVTREGEPIALQPLEYRLLEFLMRNAGRTVSREEIMEYVWHYSFAPETNILETSMSRLRAKVDRGHPVKRIETVRRQGYQVNASDASEA